MATHPSILALRMLWTEDPDGLQSMVLQSQTQLKNCACMFILIHIAIDFFKKKMEYSLPVVSYTFSKASNWVEIYSLI